MWEEPKTGPSWRDISDCMKSIGHYHGGEVTVLLRNVEHQGSPKLEITAMLQQQQGQRMSNDKPLTVWTVYPNINHKTVTGAVYGCLHRLDARAGAELYEQQALPEPPPAE